MDEALAFEAVEDFFDWEGAMMSLEQSHEILLAELIWELLKDQLNGSCILAHNSEVLEVQLSAAHLSEDLGAHFEGT